MHRSLLVVISVAAIALSSGCGSDVDRPRTSSPLDPGSSGLERGVQNDAVPADESIVLFGASTGAVDPLEVLRDLGLEHVVAEIHANVARIEDLPIDLAELELDPRIVAVQSNHGVVLGEPSDLTMAFFEGDVAPTDLDARPEFQPLRLAEVHRDADGTGIRVAILDTGVDVSHPYLQGRLELVEVPSLGPAQETADGIDDDGDGFVDEAYGHGSHVAGIVSTVAPGATLVPFRILSDDGVGTAYELALGLRAAIDADVDVINLSLSIGEESNVVSALIDRARAQGMVVIASGGNTGAEATYPAAYPGVMGTGATVADMSVLAEFSARGSGVTLAAPGTEVLSVYPGGGWATASGSSMSAAVVTGAMAVVASKLGTDVLPIAQARLQSTAVAVRPDGSVEYGGVDLLQALRGPAGRPRVELNQRP
jgi:subtilisin family serine protease